MNIAKKCMSEWINWITEYHIQTIIASSNLSVRCMAYTTHCMQQQMKNMCCCYFADFRWGGWMRQAMQNCNWRSKYLPCFSNRFVSVQRSSIFDLEIKPFLARKRAEIEYWILKTGGAPRANIDWISFHLNPSRKLQETWWYKVTWSVSSSLPGWPWQILVISQTADK